MRSGWCCRSPAREWSRPRSVATSRSARRTSGCRAPTWPAPSPPRSPPSASVTCRPTPRRPRCRAGRPSGWPSPGPWRSTRRWCSSTSRRRCSTRRRRRRCATRSLRSRPARGGRRSVRASEPAIGHPSPTLVVVEHVLGPWVDLVDRLVVLSSDGRVVADGPVRETLASERDRLLAMGIWVPGAGPPDATVRRRDPGGATPGRAHGIPRGSTVRRRPDHPAGRRHRPHPPGRRAGRCAGGCAGHADRAGRAERVGQVDRAARPRRLPRDLPIPLPSR